MTTAGNTFCMEGDVIAQTTPATVTYGAIVRNPKALPAAPTAAPILPDADVAAFGSEDKAARASRSAAALSSLPTEFCDPRAMRATPMEMYSSSRLRGVNGAGATGD